MDKQKARITISLTGVEDKEPMRVATLEGSPAAARQLYRWLEGAMVPNTKGEDSGLRVVVEAEEALTTYQGLYLGDPT